MTPWQIAKESESSHQVALFCWAAKAQKYGFGIANFKPSWGESIIATHDKGDLVPELKWLHHIPNGGSRGDNARSRAIAGGQLKAEGVKSGVFDLFWPLVCKNHNGEFADQVRYAGLYIEMKRPSEKHKDYPKHGCSPTQIEFGFFAHMQGYYVTVCYTWEEAAKVIQDYYEGKL